MSRDNSRLLMELDKYRREINREQINPKMAAVDMNALLPVVKVCARARADYIECLMRIANSDEVDCRASEQIEELRQHRLAFEELVSAANALEIVIKRDYVDVIES